MNVSALVRALEKKGFIRRPWDGTAQTWRLMHNAIPDTKIPTMFGMINARFNETYL